MLKVKAALLKKFVIPGIILALAIAAVGFVAPALEASRMIAPMRHAHLTYIRWPCTLPTAPGVCPAYRIDAFGDGTVVYRSIRGTKVEGSYVYRVPAQDLREFIRDFGVSAFWSKPIASGPDINGGACVVQLHMADETQRNGCMKWQPGSDQALNDPGISDSIAQLEALTRVNSLARGDAGTAELLRVAKPYKDR